MDPHDRETGNTSPVDEGRVFAAAVQQYLAAMPVSPDEVATYWQHIQTRIGWAHDDAEAHRPASVPRRSVQPPSAVFKHATIRAGLPLRRSVWPYAMGLVLGALLVAAGVARVTHQVGGRVAPAMTTYATTNGQHGTITLTDGSTVMLNVASRLEVPADFAAGDRTVRLRGEALFTVSHHAGTPFTVVAGGTVTRVLGTSFVVRRYGTDTMTTVAVETGKVAVGTAIVTSNRLVEIGSRGVTYAGPADASQFSFACGVLALEDMSLSQAIPELDRWYDADIRLADPALATKRIKGNVTAGSLADLTERLQVLFDVRVVREGRVLTLYPR